LEEEEKEKEEEEALRESWGVALVGWRSLIN